MANETLTASDVQDPGVRAELTKALKDKKLSFKDIKTIVAAALSDTDAATPSVKLDSTEYNDLVTLIERSSTLTNKGRNHLRKAVLINYLQHSLQVKSLKTALQKVLADSKMSLSEVDDIVTEALADEKLSDPEIADLLALRKGATNPIQRMFLYKVIIWTLNAKSPPATPVTAGSPTKVGAQRSDPLGTYHFEITILADKSADPKLSAGAYTRCDLQKTGRWITKRGQVTITEWPRVTGLEVQTSYHATANSSDISAYGRGTTDADIKAKHISLGFHEAQHREECVRFVKTVQIPEFTGASTVMTTAEFSKKIKKFEAEHKSFSKRMQQRNHKVDEVGYKLSQRKKDQKKKVAKKMMKKIKKFGWK